jgi:hypothetical protein
VFIVRSTRPPVRPDDVSAVSALGSNGRLLVSHMYTAPSSLPLMTKFPLLENEALIWRA